MKEKFRIYSKAALLLVIIGFFMPVACGQNGLQLASYLTGEMGRMGGGDAVAAGYMLYIIFIAAIAGVVIGALLLSKKNVSIGWDWASLLALGIAAIVIALKSDPDASQYFQSGVYAIVTGGILSAVFLLIASAAPPPNTTDTNAPAPPENPLFFVGKTLLTVNLSVALRKGPGLESEYICKLEQGDTVTFLNENTHTQDRKAWCKVKTKNNEEGWCFADCLGECNI
ncbi:MAG: SH3 domain-containing protein [Spirochaetales bacterium]|jgi:hypothetical protein|nr:SH3 domain-containing protein [Spirochaetales bacterium]